MEDMGRIESKRRNPYYLLTQNRITILHPKTQGLENTLEMKTDAINATENPSASSNPSKTTDTQIELEKIATMVS